MLRDTLGENVRYYRKRNELTQEEAAERCQMSSKYFGQIERGKRGVSIDMVEKISIGLKVPVEALVIVRAINEQIWIGAQKSQRYSMPQIHKAIVLFVKREQICSILQFCSFIGKRKREEEL